HFNIVLFENAHLTQRERAIESCLTAHAGQERIWALFLDDLGHHVWGDWLNIGGIGEIRVRHDRRWVRVVQNDPVTFFLKRLTSLGAGVVELARLPDDDWTRADD